MAGTGGAPDAGSIPACTGEPRTQDISPAMLRVYPRVYGGTPSKAGGRLAVRGLSPRVRGNRGGRGGGAGPGRSIPACTGEPVRVLVYGTRELVYPRVYGGTADDAYSYRALGGLSPRVRGNPLRPDRPRSAARSIPACTGEPRSATVRTAGASVYPRVYGGTRCALRFAHSGGGLSPRVRGNLIWRVERGGDAGSIPACTGEPRPGSWSARAGTVYPRVYGGTPSRIKIKWHIWPLVCINQY